MSLFISFTFGQNMQNQQQLLILHSMVSKALTPGQKLTSSDIYKFDETVNGSKEASNYAELLFKSANENISNQILIWTDIAQTASDKKIFISPNTQKVLDKLKTENSIAHKKTMELFMYAESGKPFYDEISKAHGKIDNNAAKSALSSMMESYTKLQKLYGKF